MCGGVSGTWERGCAPPQKFLFLIFVSKWYILMHDGGWSRDATVAIGSWMLRGSVAYEAGRGVSTEAARDAGGAIGHLSSGAE